MTDHDIECINLSVSLAQKCNPENETDPPKVAAVLSKDGAIIETAFRGELAPANGDHAEFTLLDMKLKGHNVSGTTLYTTLEPCTERSPEKTPCVFRIIEAKVARVVIGQLDPDPTVHGRGLLALRAANIAVEMYPPEQMAFLESINRDFVRRSKQRAAKIEVTQATIVTANMRRLDEWYRTVNSLYWNLNFRRDAESLFTHLVEVIGGLSLLASKKNKNDVNPDTYVPKAIAWWLTVCGKLGVKSVEQIIWDKFPGVCPYCQRAPHASTPCKAKKRESKGPPWEILREIAKKDGKPKTLGAWQKMFAHIYEPSQGLDGGAIFARLSEELGEMAEAIRVFPESPGYFLSEAADVFAWLMAVQNWIEHEKNFTEEQFGVAMDAAMARSYPDVCLDCGRSKCSCPPILPRTIGRIAHEAAHGRGTYDLDGRLLPQDKIAALFV